MLEDEIDYDNGTNKVVEFDFPLPLNNISQDFTKRHSDLARILDIPQDDEHLDFVFSTVVLLCDPFTQPEENENTILSVDCVADLVIALAYTKYMEIHGEELEIDIIESNGGNNNNSNNVNGEETNKRTPKPRVNIESIKFELSVQFFTIVRRIHTALNAEDELDLRYVNNDEDHDMQNIPLWTPKEALQGEEFNLKLVYAVACVLLLAIYKLFKPREGGEYNLTLNPYLHYFLRLWKCHTNVILLGLEIDRRLELFRSHHEDASEETPEIVKQTLKGSSAVRYVLAYIINQNPSLLFDELKSNFLEGENDIKDEALLNFLQPLARKKLNGGSLLIDMRLVIIALLIINSGISFTVGLFQLADKKSGSGDEAARRLNQSRRITEIGDILIDLEYDDRFDEDIRYIFEYEYDDSEADWLDVSEDEVLAPQDEQVVDGEVDLEGRLAKDVKDISLAVRVKDQSDVIEFDEQGRDWRDLPRGENEVFADWFIKKAEAFEKLEEKERQDSDDFFSSWHELKMTFEFLKTNSIEGDTEAETRMGQVVINTISKTIKDELDGIQDAQITPDQIYQYFSKPATEAAIRVTQENNKLIIPIFNITNFELLLHNNSKLARCAMDEMLMCRGYRRVLIWFMTHNINLSALLIDYVFELLAELRGNQSRQTPYLFTRQGEKLVFSEVEQLMLLHEFLTNCSIYLSATDGIEIDDGYKVVLAESIAKKYMSLLCLMVNQLINIGIIDLSIPNGEDDDIKNYKNELQVLLINWVGKLPEARQLFFKIKNSSIEEKQKEEPSTTESTVGYVYDKKEQAELFEWFAPRSTAEINEELERDKHKLLIVEDFTHRIESHLYNILGVEKKSKMHLLGGLKQTTEDIQFFFQHFNTLCKIELVAESLFEEFENIVSTGPTKVVQVPTDHTVENKNEAFDAEFNSEFLNGEGEFKPLPATSSSSKKKSKKKKKGKKRS